MGTKHFSLLMAMVFLTFVVISSIFSNFIFIVLDWNLDNNLNAVNLPPFQELNYTLGTNVLGQNVIALILSGSKYSLGISFLSALFAGTLGVFIGAIAGYFGDTSVKIKRYHLINFSLMVPMFWYYLDLSYDLNNAMQIAVSIILAILLPLIIWKFLTQFFDKNQYLKTPINLPVDILNTKITEIVFAIPSYFIILTFAFILGNGLWSIIVVLSLTSWPQSALLMRAEILKLRETNFINALNISGIGHFQILFRHAIPNAIRPVLVNLVFFISGMLIVESTLSYIGIGLSSDVITWGKVIAGFKQNTANWWVALFPGVFVFLSILSFHKIGKWLEAKLLY